MLVKVGDGDAVFKSLMKLLRHTRAMRVQAAGMDPRPDRHHGPEQAFRRGAEKLLPVTAGA